MTGPEEPAEQQLTPDPDRRRAERAEQRLRELGQQLLEHDERRSPDLAGVIEAVTGQIRREARAGRDVPMPGTDDVDRLVVTEGALRGRLREVADDVPGVVVARCAVQGDLDDPGARIGARLAISVAWSLRLSEVAGHVRERVRAELVAQTGRPPGEIDVEVLDLHAFGEQA